MNQPHIVSMALELLVAQGEGEPIAFHAEAELALGLALEIMQGLGRLESTAQQLLDLAYVLEVKKRSPSAAAVIFDVLSNNDEAAVWLRTTLTKADRERLAVTQRRFARFMGRPEPTTLGPEEARRPGAVLRHLLIRRASEHDARRNRTRFVRRTR